MVVLVVDAGDCAQAIAELGSRGVHAQRVVSVDVARSLVRDLKVSVVVVVAHDRTEGLFALLGEVEPGTRVLLVSQRMRTHLATLIATALGLEDPN